MIIRSMKKKMKRQQEENDATIQGLQNTIDEITDEKKDNIIEFFTKLFPVCNGKVEIISEDEYITLYGDE